MTPRSLAPTRLSRVVAAVIQKFNAEDERSLRGEPAKNRNDWSELTREKGPDAQTVPLKRLGPRDTTAAADRLYSAVSWDRSDAPIYISEACFL